MRNLFALLLAIGMLASINAYCESIEGVDFSVGQTVDGKDLALNGVGLRKVSKFGIPVKVYVAGLYLPHKTMVADEVFKMEGVKVIDMVFVRRVDGSAIQEAFENGHYQNCIEDCDNSKKALKELNKLIGDVLDKGKIHLEFHADHVVLNMAGRKESKGTIQGAAFSKNMLAVFLGKTPPTEDLKNGLLGLKK